MGHPQARVGQRDARHQGGVAHDGPGGDVVGALENPRQGLEGGRQRGADEGPGKRATKPADDRLHKLRNGVEARGRRDLAATRHGQGGIHQGGPRHHQGASHALLEPPPRAGDDRVAGRLGSGPGSRRNGDDRQGRANDRQPTADTFEVIHHHLLVDLGEVRHVGSQCRDRLREVDCRSAADRDHDRLVGLFARKSMDGCYHRRNGGLAHAGRDPRHGKSRGFEPTCHPRFTATRLHAVGTGNQPRRAAEPGHQLAEFADSSGTKDDGRRYQKIVAAGRLRRRHLRRCGGHGNGARGQSQGMDRRRGLAYP